MSSNTDVNEVYPKVLVAKDPGTNIKPCYKF